MSNISKIAQEFPVLADSVDDMQRRLEGAVKQLKHNLGGLRTGRPSASLLDDVRVEAYGDDKKIKEIGAISIPDSRTLMVKIWDKALVKSVEKVVRESGLGLNPVAEGDTIRVSIPDLTGEQRKLMAKKSEEHGEKAKVAVRMIRQSVMESLKKMEKAKELSEDESKSAAKKLQSEFDGVVGEVDKLVAAKVSEIIGGS